MLRRGTSACRGVAWKRKASRVDSGHVRLHYTLGVVDAWRRPRCKHDLTPACITPQPQPPSPANKRGPMLCASYRVYDPLLLAYTHHHTLILSTIHTGKTQHASQKAPQCGGNENARCANPTAVHMPPPSKHCAQDLGPPHQAISSCSRPKIPNLRNPPRSCSQACRLFDCGSNPSCPRGAI